MTAGKKGPSEFEKAVEGIITSAVALLERSGPWFRLWSPELAVGVPAVVVAAGRLRPTPTVRWTSFDQFDAWRAGLVWPSRPTIAATVIIAGLIIAAVTACDFRVGEDWRRARTLRWRWESSPLGRGSRLRRIRVSNGAITATCTIRDGNWTALKEKLDPEKGDAMRYLHLDRRWGSPIRAAFSTAGHRNPTRSRTLKLNFVPLGSALDLAPYEEPLRGMEVMVGETVDGPLYVNLLGGPHTQIVGGTGKGKGFFIKLVECQALRAGWLGVTIDGGDSPEHAPLEDAPTWLCPMSDDQMGDVARYQQTIAALDMVAEVALRRKRLCKLFDVDKWSELPGPVKAWQPPIAVIVDEATALLAKEKEKELDDLRDKLAHRLDTKVLRNGRKFGVFVLPISDQFAYSGVFSKAAAMQAENRLVLGNMASEHVRQATGLPSLPTVSEKIGAGHYVEFGDVETVQEIRIPPNDRATLKRAVAYVRGEAA